MDISMDLSMDIHIHGNPGTTTYSRTLLAIQPPHQIGLLFVDGVGET